MGNDIFRSPILTRNHVTKGCSSLLADGSASEDTKGHSLFSSIGRLSLDLFLVSFSEVYLNETI